jgi:hypothetical protein
VQQRYLQIFVAGAGVFLQHACMSRATAGPAAAAGVQHQKCRSVVSLRRLVSRHQLAAYQSFGRGECCGVFIAVRQAALMV